MKAVTDNPFYVLGLPRTASAMEIEREGSKLLAMLELQLAESKSYGTPLGAFARSPEKVREAMAELRDPARRLVHEVFAALPATPLATGIRAPPPERTRWPRAPVAFSLGPERK